ncbi:MAG: LLM class F420-dependent oxidoreductase [Acidobacteriota bacterium]|nr:LLM class F420-dependent oxidoreductase [Acidobacteriota bacterium]
MAPDGQSLATPRYLEVVCQEAEARHVDRIWVGEHVVLFDDYASRYPYAADGRIPVGGETGLLDPLVTLAFMAAHTTRVRLGTAMCLLPQRNPVYTAKEVASLDWLSGGRVDFGVGVGWLREEFEALGVPWPARGRRTDEYLAVVRALWEDDPSEFHGELFDLPACRQQPKPLQRPVPVHVGGESDAALRRVARRANGWVPFDQDPEALARLMGRLDEALEAEGRRRPEIEVTVCPYLKATSPGQVADYAEAGATTLAAVLLAFDESQVPAAFDALTPLQEAAGALA